MTRPPFARAGVQASAASGLDRRQLAEQLRHRAHPSVGRPRPDRQHPGALWAATRICPLRSRAQCPCVRSMIARRDGRESCGRATHGASRTPLYTRFASLPDTFEDTDIYDAFAGPRRALSASRYRRVTRFCRRSVRGAPDGAISTRRQGVGDASARRRALGHRSQRAGDWYASTASMSTGGARGRHADVLTPDGCCFLLRAGPRPSRRRRLVGVQVPGDGRRGGEQPSPGQHRLGAALRAAGVRCRRRGRQAGRRHRPALSSRSGRSGVRRG